MANEKQKAVCDSCENVEVLATIGKLHLCQTCYAKEVMTLQETKETKEIEVEPSTSPINERLKRAYIDKVNGLLTSEMTHSQLKEHIADLEDMVKVLNTQVQAAMDVDEQWARDLSAEEREKLRIADKQYRAKARPALNSDGTLKVKPKSAPKEVIVGDAGDKAFENLVEKLTRTGKTREQAVKIIESLRGKK